MGLPVNDGCERRRAPGHARRIGRLRAAATGAEPLQVVEPASELTLPTLPVPVPRFDCAAVNDVRNQYAVFLDRVIAVRAAIYHG